uniref:4-hydroxy-tetrahydrodipicolinate synthase n=2 Tax=Ditylum brightwellii TaxID=49249 RepID=A0A7S4QNY9_9STRA
MRPLILAAVALLASADAFQSSQIRRAGLAFSPSRTRSSSTAITASNANEIVPLKQGSTVALITPMTPTGEVDMPALRNILRFHVESGTDGLCILGTTGEASTLSMAERATVLTAAVEEVKGKIPIMAGVGTIDPEHVKEMTQQAIDVGCDAALVVTPYYVKPPQRGLVKHFLTMAEMGLPVVIYNVPGRTGVDFQSNNLALCADHENIVALKDATGDLDRLEEVRNYVGDKLLLYSGDDSTEAEYVLRGGDGCISVTANVAPAQMHNLIMAALNKDVAEVEKINGPLKELHNNLFCEANPIPAKWAVKRIGKMDSAYCRPPLDELAPEFHSLIEASLTEAGLLLPTQ